MLGFGYFLKGLDLIRQPRLRFYVVVPLAINIVVFVVMVYSGFSLFDTWLSSWMSSLPEWLSFLSWIMWVLFVLVAAAFAFFAFTIIANFIASPFNALLAVKVAERARVGTGKQLAQLTLLQVIPRALAREVAKLLYYLPRLIGLLILTVIPGLNLIAPIVWVLFGCWMMCVQYSDYAADNDQVSFSELRRRLAMGRVTGLSFGLIVYGALLVPVLNLIVIPAAVAGGTVMWVEEFDQPEQVAS